MSDSDDSIEARVERFRRQAEDQYEQTRANVKATPGWRVWKRNLTPAQRIYLVGAAVFVVMLVAYLVATYWGVTPLPNPSGEGG